MYSSSLGPTVYDSEPKRHILGLPTGVLVFLGLYNNFFNFLLDVVEII